MNPISVPNIAPFPTMCQLNLENKATRKPTINPIVRPPQTAFRPRLKYMTNKIIETTPSIIQMLLLIVIIDSYLIPHLATHYILIS